MNLVHLAPASIEAVAQRVLELQRIRSAPPTPERITATIDELQTMLGAKSRRATQWQLQKLGVRAYSKGKYRLRDVENAVARRSRA